MKSQIVITVEHGEDTDRLQSMIAHIQAEYDESMSTVYPGRPMILDYEVKVDIEAENAPMVVSLSADNVTKDSIAYLNLWAMKQDNNDPLAQFVSRISEGLRYGHDVTLTIGK